MKIYDAMTPNTLRTSIFLAEKGLDVDRVKVDIMGGGTRTPEFLAINSLGELPVLELDDGRRITETIAICRYFEELHSEPNLMGKDAYEKTHIEMWNRRMEQQLFMTFSDVARHSLEFFADKVEQMPEFAAMQKRTFEKKWAWFDNEMSDGRPYVVGDRFTIADITGMAVIIVSDFTGVELPGGRKFAKRWEASMRARPSFASLMAERAAA